VTADVFLQPLDLSHFAPSAPDVAPGFTQLVQDVLGDAASPVDGFDAALTDAAALVEALDAALGALDGELFNAFAEADLVDPQEAADNAAAFAVSSAAINATVDNFGTLVGVPATPVAGNPPPPTQPPPGPAPVACEPGTATDFPGVPVNAIRCVPNSKVGGSTQSIYLTQALTGNPPAPIVASAVVESGDPAVWSITHDRTLAGGKVLADAIHVTVTPTKAGRFTALVRVKWTINVPDFVSYWVTRVQP
jgi:hypothetical protein